MTNEDVKRTIKIILLDIYPPWQNVLKEILHADYMKHDSLQS